MIKYGTELVYEGNIIYYSTFNYITGKHLCYYNEEGKYFPTVLSLKREEFKIRKSKENKESAFVPALL